MGMHLFMGMHVSRKSKENATQFIYFWPCMFRENPNFWPCMFRENPRKMRLNASISGHACFEKIQGKCDSMHLFLAMHVSRKSKFLAMHVSRKSKENATQCIYFWPCMFRENPRKMRLNASISGHACFEKIQISG